MLLSVSMFVVRLATILPIARFFPVFRNCINNLYMPFYEAWRFLIQDNPGLQHIFAVPKHGQCRSLFVGSTNTESAAMNSSYKWLWVVFWIGCCPVYWRHVPFNASLRNATTIHHKSSSLRGVHSAHIHL